MTVQSHSLLYEELLLDNPHWEGSTEQNFIGELSW